MMHRRVFVTRGTAALSMFSLVGCSDAEPSGSAESGSSGHAGDNSSGPCCTGSSSSGDAGSTGIGDAGTSGAGTSTTGGPEGSTSSDSTGELDSSTGEGVCSAEDACSATQPNPLGPFYRDGAPLQMDIAQDVEGTSVVVRGTVIDDVCCPIAGALLDIWQADPDGHYDNDGSSPPPPPDVFRLRGRVETDGRGAYEFHTVLPGHYLNGAQFRPAHIHVQVSAPGFATVTTQLYFPGDPYNDADGFFDASLLVTVEDEQPSGLITRYTFVLASAS